MKQNSQVLNVQNIKIRDWFLAKYVEHIVDIRKKGEKMPMEERANFYKTEAKKIYKNKPIYNDLWRHSIEDYLNTGRLVVPQSDAYCVMPSKNKLLIRIGKTTKLKDIELIWTDVEAFQKRLHEKPVITSLDPVAFEIYKEKINNPKKTYEEIVALPKFNNYTSGHAKKLKSAVEKVLKLL